MTFCQAGYVFFKACCQSKGEIKMSEMTNTDQEPEQDETPIRDREAQDAADADEEVNPAIQKAPNPEGNPEDDRMGAPAVMPD